MIVDIYGQIPISFHVTVPCLYLEFKASYMFYYASYLFIVRSITSLECTTGLKYAYHCLEELLDRNF